MPFLGKDWRSSGDQWIRTEHGWERCKVLECILDNLSIGLKKEKISKKQQRRLNSEGNESTDTSPKTSQFYLGDENEENYKNDEAESTSDESEVDLDDSDDDTDEEKATGSGSEVSLNKKLKKNSTSLSRLCLSNGSIERYNYKTRQPHIIFCDIEATNRENKAPKASVSDVLTALDMPGAVRDIKRFNYVCRLVQIIINEKLHHLSGNAQRTLFMIVKQMLIQVIKTQENLNVMRKLLFDFKKKIQDSYYFYFYYIGSQKLSEKHLATITKWQDLLENPNHKRVKRLTSHHHFLNNKRQISNSPMTSASTSQNDKENKSEPSKGFDNIPVDCKLEIMRRLNTGLDLINLSKCNRNLNDIISKELTIWKNLCQFHFQQTSINSFLNKSNNGKLQSEKEETVPISDLDWKMIYFKLKRRYGHREVYVDMIYKCQYCKCLFWKEIGHPCILANCMNVNEDGTSVTGIMETRIEPITPKKLIDLLLK